MNNRIPRVAVRHGPLPDSSLGIWGWVYGGNRGHLMSEDLVETICGLRLPAEAKRWRITRFEPLRARCSKCMRRVTANVG